LVGIKAWATVLALVSARISSKADVTMGIVTVSTAGAPWVGVGSVRADLTAVAGVIQLLAGGALVTGDRALDEVETSSDAVSTGSGLGSAGVLSDGT
jgi:hypothetical protein